jgi:hypothetical protein
MPNWRNLHQRANMTKIMFQQFGQTIWYTPSAIAFRALEDDIAVISITNSRIELGIGVVVHNLGLI